MPKQNQSKKGQGRGRGRTDQGQSAGLSNQPQNRNTSPLSPPGRGQPSQQSTLAGWMQQNQEQQFPMATRQLQQIPVRKRNQKITYNDSQSSRAQASMPVSQGYTLKNQPQHQPPPGTMKKSSTTILEELERRMKPQDRVFKPKEQSNDCQVVGTIVSKHPQPQAPSPPPMTSKSLIAKALAQSFQATLRQRQQEVAKAQAEAQAQYQAYVQAQKLAQQQQAEQEARNKPAESSGSSSDSSVEVVTSEEPVPQRRSLVSTKPVPQPKKIIPRGAPASITNSIFTQRSAATSQTVDISDRISQLAQSSFAQKKPAYHDAFSKERSTSSGIGFMNQKASSFSSNDIKQMLQKKFGETARQQKLAEEQAKKKYRREKKKQEMMLERIENLKRAREQREKSKVPSSDQSFTIGSSGTLTTRKSHAAEQVEARFSSDPEPEGSSNQATSRDPTREAKGNSEAAQVEPSSLAQPEVLNQAQAAEVLQRRTSEEEEERRVQLELRKEKEREEARRLEHQQREKRRIQRKSIDDFIEPFLNLSIMRMINGHDEFEPLPDRFENAQEYREKWEPLFLYETYCSLLSSKNKSDKEREKAKEMGLKLKVQDSRDRNFKGKVVVAGRPDRFTYLHLFQDEEREEPRDKDKPNEPSSRDNTPPPNANRPQNQFTTLNKSKINKLNLLRDYDLLLLSSKEIPEAARNIKSLVSQEYLRSLIDETQTYLAMVESKRQFDEIFVTLRISSQKGGFTIRSDAAKVYVYYFESLATSVREYRTIRCSEFYPTTQLILNPSQIVLERRFDTSHIKRNFLTEFNHMFNCSQRRAIKRVADMRKSEIVLIQGPPGTGKTHTIKGLISMANLSTPRKILVCAPSNAAIDEIVTRLISKNGLYGSDLEESKNRIVRIGALEYEPSPLVNQVYYDTKFEALSQKTCLSQEEDARIKTELIRCRKKVQTCEKILKILHQNEATSRKEELKELVLTILKNKDELQQYMQQSTGEQIRMVKDYKHRTLSAEIKGYKSKLKNGFGHLSWETRKELEKRIIQESKIICTTLGKSNCDKLDILEPGTIEYLIVDEASQCIELSNLIPFEHNPSKIVLVGDQAQLPATTFSDNADRTKVSRSFFERIIQCGGGHLMLEIQYRMHPLIRKFPSDEFYDGKLEDAPSIGQRSTKDLNPAVQMVLKRHAPVQFIDLEYTKESQSETSKTNVKEAQFIVDLIEGLIRQMASEKQQSALVHRDQSAFKKDAVALLEGKLGIISSYKSQVNHLKDVLFQFFSKIIQFEKASSIVEVNTVDSFQGREKDVIIFSCVRSSEERTVGFLQDYRRMNVAITRAKHALIVVGNSRTMKTQQNWRAFIKFCQDQRETTKYLAFKAFQSQNQAYSYIKAQIDNSPSEEPKPEHEEQNPDENQGQNPMPNPEQNQEQEAAEKEANLEPEQSARTSKAETQAAQPGADEKMETDEGEEASGQQPDEQASSSAQPLVPDQEEPMVSASSRGNVDQSKHSDLEEGEIPYDREEEQRLIEMKKKKRLHSSSSNDSGNCRKRSHRHRKALEIRKQRHHSSSYEWVLSPGLKSKQEAAGLKQQAPSSSGQAKNVGACESRVPSNQEHRSNPSSPPASSVGNIDPHPVAGSEQPQQPEQPEAAAAESSLLDPPQEAPSVDQPSEAENQAISNRQPSSVHPNNQLEERKEPLHIVPPKNNSTSPRPPPRSNNPPQSDRSNQPSQRGWDRNRSYKEKWERRRNRERPEDSRDYHRQYQQEQRPPYRGGGNNRGRQQDRDRYQERERRQDRGRRQDHDRYQNRDHQWDQDRRHHEESSRRRSPPDWHRKRDQKFEFKRRQ